MINEEPGKHQAEAAADAEDGRDHPDAGADLLARELVVDDRE
jgi:hypothetical protein